MDIGEIIIIQKQELGISETILLTQWRVLILKLQSNIFKKIIIKECRIYTLKSKSKAEY